MISVLIAEGDILTLNSALLGAISALAGVAVFLFRQLQVTRSDMDAKLNAQMESSNKRFQDCEDDRRNLWRELCELKSQVHGRKPSTNNEGG